MMVAKGWTAYICVGRYAGFHLSFRRGAFAPGAGVVLGWLSIGVIPLDIEVAVNRLLEIIDEAGIVPEAHHGD